MWTLVLAVANREVIWSTAASQSKLRHVGLRKVFNRILGCMCNRKPLYSISQKNESRHFSALLHFRSVSPRISVNDGDCKHNLLVWRAFVKLVRRW